MLKIFPGNTGVTFKLNLQCFPEKVKPKRHFYRLSILRVIRVVVCRFLKKFLTGGKVIVSLLEIIKPLA